MTTQEYLCRHFARMGARVVVRGPRLRQRTKIAIDVGRDRSGEVFVIGCEERVAIEVIDVQPRSHHLVLMVRDGTEKHKFLLGAMNATGLLQLCLVIVFAMCEPQLPACVLQR